MNENRIQQVLMIEKEAQEVSDAAIREGCVGGLASVRSSFGCDLTAPTAIDGSPAAAGQLSCFSMIACLRKEPLFQMQTQ